MNFNVNYGYNYFPEKEYTYKIMFNSEENFAKLVMASMGNTRDFGTMLLKMLVRLSSV